MFKFKPDMYKKDIYEINYEKLQDLGIKYLFFDLDNTIITYKENLKNRTNANDCEFFKGIAFRNNYYIVSICYKKNSVYLGQYKKFHEALFARFFAEKMIFGEVKQMERPTKLSEERKKEIADKVIAKVVLLQTA